jgi:regulator of replication initiation timing
MTQIEKISRFLQYLAVFIVVVVITYLVNNDARIRSKMTKLNTENIELRIANDNLKKERVKLNDSIRYVWEEMDRVIHVEQLLLDENRILQDELDKLNPKYEKIKRTVPRLTADSIRRYFANL